MPTVRVDPDELRDLTGHYGKSDDALREDLFALGLEFEGWTDDDEFELEFEADRLDRLSVEGVARSLRYQYGDDRGVYVPTVNDAEWTIHVDADVPDERPYVTGAVVRGLDLDETTLESIIQLQEKLHATMGRGRAKGAIGVHDLTMLKGAAATGSEETDAEADDPRVEAAPAGGKSVRYTGIGRMEDRFVPLDSEIEMRPDEVLKGHSTGHTYADLVDDYERMPAIYDDLGLFSFPPVINGKRTEVTTESRDLFVEMTGTDQWTIDRMLAIVCYALDARGGRVEEVTVEYADDASGEYAGASLVRPDFGTKSKTVAHADVESMLGVDLDGEEVVDLLERSGLGAETVPLDDDGDPMADAESGHPQGTPPAVEDGEAALGYEATVPPYRVDVLHPVDVIDDVGRAYGFNNLDPRYPDVSTLGGRHERSRVERAARETLIGLGFQDLLNFHLIGREENYDRLHLERPASVAEVDGADDLHDAFADPSVEDDDDGDDGGDLDGDDGGDLDGDDGDDDNDGGDDDVQNSTDDDTAWSGDGDGDETEDGDGTETVDGDGTEPENTAADTWAPAAEHAADGLADLRPAEPTDVLGGEAPAVIKEPYSEDYEIVRTWALPSLMLVLENNTHRSYPQDLAEVGFTAHKDEAEETKVAERRTVSAVVARNDASYEDARARLQAVCRAFETELETPATEHPTFISGRTAEVVIDGESLGVIGEVHPAVLVEHDLEVPVAAFEFDLDALR